MNEASRNAVKVCPPRRGEVWAQSVNSTATAYDITGLALAGKTKGKVYVALQAMGGDVYFHFDSATSNGLSDTAAVAVGGSAAFADTYGPAIPQGATHEMWIDRAVDKFVVFKCASGSSAIVRMWAVSGVSK